MNASAQRREPAAAARSGSKRTSPSGVLVIDKPAGITSHVVVHRIRRRLKLKKVGHCGTLDPFATGVLVICVNQATRIAEYLLAQDKVYRFILHLGVRTDTQDPTGEVIATHDGPPVNGDQLERVLARFRGRIDQQIPRYAAVKIDGKRLYQYARQGIEVERPSRAVTIHRLELIDYQWPHAQLEAHSSKGTYIRQLADDIGEALGCGAHVASLQRVASGRFHVDDAYALDALLELCSDDRWTARLISLNRALEHLAGVVLEDPHLLRRLQNGQLDLDWEVQQRKRYPDSQDPVRLLTPDQKLLALWWPRPQAGQRRLRVFQPPQE